MSGVKAALRAINESIRVNKYDDAIKQARELVWKEPKNYQGLVFLAFALDKRNQLAEAQAVYKEAAQVRPKDPQVYQGLVQLYEKQGTKKLGDYQEAVVNLAHIFYDVEDLYKAQDAVDKFVDFARINGDKLQYADALWIQTPESPLYGILEGRFPHPEKTYETIAHILEDFETKRINTLVGERRTRLGVSLSEVKTEVKREVYAQSRLEHIYRQLINWTSNDDVRRNAEERLLWFCHERLLITPTGPIKVQEQSKVFGLAKDMVAIKHPCKLAWDIAIDWQDHKKITGWDVDLLRTYCAFFPDSDTYKVITAFMTSPFSPFPKFNEHLSNTSVMDSPTEDSDDDDEDGGVPTSFIPLTDEDRLIMISEGISGNESAFSYRLVGAYFLNTGDYESAVEFMRKARLFISQERVKLGISYENTNDAFALYLATSLVYYQSPRHHQEAKGLFEKVLIRDSNSTSALIGVGLIFEEEEEYDQAIDFLERALERDDTNVRVRSEAAWIKALKGDWESAKAGLLACLPLLDQDSSRSTDLLADIQYRLGCCIWNMDTSRQARKQRKGECAYAYWLSALKNDMNHASTYSSLGIFYNDYAADRKRARRCFQKALEISPAEVVAAERLATSFAEEGDWERVELAAQRIINSGKVKPPPGSKRKGISWPFAAMGVAELNKQDFHKAIVSFQAALRLSPKNYHSWVGLGESYYSSGRYIAATKALANAQAIESQIETDMFANTWFTKYMLGNIKRELGEFDESIALYRAVIDTHPEEQGVVISLMQTMVDNALTSVEKGVFGKAIQLAIEAIEFANTAPPSVKETFNFWKSLADATSIFSVVQSRVTDFPSACVRELLKSSHQEAFELWTTIDKVGTDVVYAKGIYTEDEQFGVDVTRCMHVTILCCKEAVHICNGDTHAQAVAFYNLGWAEYRAHACLPANLRKKPSNYIKASVRAFKRAIEMESGNADFWNALGVITSQINPSVSQHAFVRSLHIDERSPVGWTNFGVLALFSGDHRLAKEAFTRSQSADPEYAHAWVGQGFLALLEGNLKEARGMFTHAMDIADSSSLVTRKHYSASMFDHMLANASSIVTPMSLAQPLFGLGQVHSLRPQELSFGHLSALFEERSRDNLGAVKKLERLCRIIEADYEGTESTESLTRFIMARVDLARAYLAAGQSEDAVECGDMALSLSSDETENELTAEQSKKARLSAHLTVGLGKYFLGDFQAARACFETALEESNGNADATCLLAQVLWAQGTEDSRDLAREALFGVVEKDPGHVQSVVLLGVVALLDEDEGSLEAVVEELQGLRTKDVSQTEQSRIGEVLRSIAGLADGHTQQNMLQQVQQDVMLHPNLPHGWSSLAETTGSQHAAQMAVKVAVRGIPPRGLLEAEDLASAYAGTGKADDAQRAAFLSPWASSNWVALGLATRSI